ncbi:MAG: hypothetical protein IPH71_05830 [Proteobacteria bacterium]|nr:hypothetical protein [Pseudomonadota bacterium]
MTPTRWSLKPDARVTCPKCEHEFSLEQGFARHALENIEAASASFSVAQLREQERAAADKRRCASAAAGTAKQAIEEARRQACSRRSSRDEASRRGQQGEALQKRLDTTQQQLRSCARRAGA